MAAAAVRASVGGVTTAAIDPLDPAWVRERPDRAGYRRDALLAGVLLVGATVVAILYSNAVVYKQPAPLWVTMLYLVAISTPIAFRRRAPQTVAIIISVVFVTATQVRVPELLICNISLFIALYSVGAWSSHRARGAVLRWLIIVGMLSWLLWALITGPTNSYFPRTSGSVPMSPFVAIGLVQLLTNLLYFGGAYYFGEHAWTSARQRAALELRTSELATERQITADRAVAGERIRIARELHDVVAHHVSVMGIQAGAARRVLDSDTAEAATALLSIESSARTAVDELHHMLSTLRDDDAGAPDAASESPSTRGVVGLDGLVAEAAAAGLTIRRSTIGESRALPPTVDSTVFRVTQEAITNVIKHAGVGVSVDLRLRYLDAAVEIEVANTGVGRPSTAGPGGHGQLGMRERVEAVGGSIQIGPRARGGYLVRATIPSPVVTA
jgi:signal transduction histidine kinase